MRNFTGRNKDKWEKAISHDKHALGVFKEDGSLIGLKPIELSNPIDYFLIDAEENFGSGVALWCLKFMKLDLLFLSNLRLS